MLTDDFLKEVNGKQIVIIFFFWKKMDINSARLLGYKTEKQIKAIDMTRKCTAKVKYGKIYLQNRKILGNKILNIYRDCHIHNLIYILGVDFTCTLYIFDSKKR